MSRSWTMDGSPIRLAQQQTFRLGALEIRPATREVVRERISRILEPRIMQVLVALAEAEGRVVSRDELVARCWDGRIVGDNALHRAVGRLRDLASTMGDGAFRIETIPRVGYRLVAPSRPGAPPCAPPHNPVFATAGPASIPAPIPVPAPVAAPARGLPRRAALIGGVAALAVGTGLGGREAHRRAGVAARVEALMAQSLNAMRLDLPDSRARGEGFLKEAAALAPRDAAVWGRLALVRETIATYASPEVAGMAVAASQEAAQRALEIDPRQIDARAALALLPPHFGDWRAAERRMRTVLAADPDHLPTLDALGFLLGSVGRNREQAHTRIAYSRRDPLHAGLQYRLVYAYWMLGRLEEADRAAERALELWPRHPAVWLVRLWTLAFTGRAGRALSHVMDVGSRPQMPAAFFLPLEAAMRALVSGAAADRALAARALLAQVDAYPSASVNGVMLFNALGDVDRAFDVAHGYLLERGPIMASVRWRAGQPSVNDESHRKTAMLFVPVAAPMRADPRFAALTRDVGLDAYWTAARVTPDHLA